MEPMERIRMCRMLEKMEQLPECSGRLGIRNTSHEPRAGKGFYDAGDYKYLRNRNKD